MKVCAFGLLGLAHPLGRASCWAERRPHIANAMEGIGVGR